jgi:hypothetical protein
MEITTTGGGPENCVFEPERQGPAGIFRNCFDASTVSNNAIIGGTGPWPSGNFTPKDVGAVGLDKDGEGLAAFRLCRAKSASCKGPSKYINAGKDRKDLGADIDALISAVKGVVE